MSRVVGWSRVVAWSRVVGSPAEARAVLADPGDALELRAEGTLDGQWAALGFIQLVPGELARPLPVVLAGVGQTHALGVRLASGLRAGDLLVLSGPLGAGKTALTQGIGAGLGVRGPVTSPTFVLARTHPGPLPLVHVDAYRLRDAAGAQLDDLELDETLPYSVTVVEWGEGIVELLAESRLHVYLARDSAQDDDRRTARVVAHGPRWAVAPRQC